MGAMIIGIITGSIIYAFYFFVFIFYCFFTLTPPIVLRFFYFKRPLQKSEWQKLVKIECIFFGLIIAVLSLIYIIESVKTNDFSVGTLIALIASKILVDAVIVLIQKVITVFPKIKK